MGSRKTKAMAELIDRVAYAAKYKAYSPGDCLALIRSYIEDYRAEFHGPKQRAVKEKKKSKAQAKIEESRIKYTWSWQVPKEVMDDITRLMDEEDAAKAEAKAAKAAKRRAKKGVHPA